LRDAPIEARKGALAKVLRRPGAGIVLNAHCEADGVIVYRQACVLGCEGIVSKRLGLRYVPGRARCWVKVKNPEAPGVRRHSKVVWRVAREIGVAFVDVEL